jgi:hypothetical protein
MAVTSNCRTFALLQSDCQWAIKPSQAKNPATSRNLTYQWGGTLSRRAKPERGDDLYVFSWPLESTPPQLVTSTTESSPMRAASDHARAPYNCDKVGHNYVYLLLPLLGLLLCHHHKRRDLAVAQQ